MDTSFYCQECGYKFRTVKAAERASFGVNGCPKCGGADIDLGRPTPTVPCPAMTSRELVAQGQATRAPEGYDQSGEWDDYVAHE